jgi:hypothetical protein
VPLPFLLPGEEGQDEGGRKTILPSPRPSPQGEGETLATLVLFLENCKFSGIARRQGRRLTAINSILTQNPGKSAFHRSRLDVDSTQSVREATLSTADRTHSTRERTPSTSDRTQSARERSLSTSNRTHSTRERSLSTSNRTHSTRERSLSTSDRTLSTRERSLSASDRTPSTSSFDFFHPFSAQPVSKVVTRRRPVEPGDGSDQIIFFDKAIFSPPRPVPSDFSLAAKLFLIFSTGFNKHNLLQLSNLQHLKIALGMTLARCAVNNDLS